MRTRIPAPPEEGEATTLAVGYDRTMVRMTVLPERLAQAVAERVVALVVDALDVNALLERVDVDALLARIDLPALLEQVDVEALLERVDIDRLVARIDLASTVRSTTTSAAEDAIGALRRTTARGDQAATRWADRLVGRR